MVQSVEPFFLTPSIVSQYLLYILTSIQVLRTPNSCRNMNFQRFLVKSWKNKNIETVLTAQSYFSCTDKNIERADFDQRLECAAPKHWSNYTIQQFKYKWQVRINMVKNGNSDIIFVLLFFVVVLIFGSTHLVLEYFCPIILTFSAFCVGHYKLAQCGCA